MPYVANYSLRYGKKLYVESNEVPMTYEEAQILMKHGAISIRRNRDQSAPEGPEPEESEPDRPSPECKRPRHARGNRRAAGEPVSEEPETEGPADGEPVPAEETDEF